MNKKEIQAYQSAFEKFNPFYGVDFPITSVKLCELINKMRNDHNEKVVELRHDHLMNKTESLVSRLTPRIFGWLKVHTKTLKVKTANVIS